LRRQHHVAIALFLARLDPQFVRWLSMSDTLRFATSDTRRPGAASTSRPPPPGFSTTGTLPAIIADACDRADPFWRRTADADGRYISLDWIAAMRSVVIVAPGMTTLTNSTAV
jgi:hypothetical protein